jgi:predicted GNAT superfamily acetyltransferase
VTTPRPPGTEPIEAAAPPVTVRPLRSPEELRGCVELQRETWGPDFIDKVPERVLAIAQRLGGIVSGAFDEHGEMLGFVFGLTGVANGRVVHWSDMLAVRSGARNRGIGEALKRHQRERLLADGVAVASWTFEPLESRNAHINFALLGVVAREYVRDFYAQSTSPLHQGIGTDRLIVDWEIAGDRVSRRLSGADRPPTLEATAAWPVVNAVRGGSGSPVSDEPDPSLESARVRIAVPSTIQQMKEKDPDLALDWRLKARGAFERYFARGYTATEFVRDEAIGYYVLERRTGVGEV